MNIFARLLAPKNKIFYELFEKSADNVKQMGQLLTQVVGEPDFDKRQGIITQMEDVEHANDELTHLLFTELVHHIGTAANNIADDATTGPPAELLDDVVWKPARVRRERFLEMKASDLPMSCRAVLAG